jgi:membrane associated rhomboid family serine protease
MTQASVGFHCPECSGAGRTRVVSGRAAFRAAGDPTVTKVLVGLNVAVFLVAVAVGGDAMDAGGPVFEWGATFGPLIGQGEVHRLVTGAFLHAGILHLAMNMYLLWLLGKVLEPALGHARFALLYGASLLGGALGVMLVTPTAATVGASGAVFGLMGAMVVLQYRAGQNPWQSGILGLVMLNLVITFMVPGISIGGHIGGLLTGGVAALGMTLGSARTPVPTIAHITGLLVLCAVLATGAVLAVA